MANYSIEVDVDQQSDYPTVLPGVNRRLDNELDVNGIQYVSVPREGYLSIDPIQEVKAQYVRNNWETADFVRNIPSNRYKKLKPLWLIAEIWKHHIGRGEETFVSESLSNLIRTRGIYDSQNLRNSSNDDCGHIVAASLGGKMVDINLFPQNKELNRGWKGNYFIWRVIEMCMKLWVTTILPKYRPRVKFQMLLYYDNPTYADRPDRFKYMVQFLMDDDSSDSEGDDDEKISLSNVLFNVAELSLQCRNEVVETLKSRIKAVVARMSSRCKANVEEFLEELSTIIAQIEYPRPEPIPIPTRTVSSTPHRDRSISFWDFLPIVGSVKTIVEGAEDVADGNIGSAAANLAIGSVCLGLDLVTLGSVSTVVGGLGKFFGKEAAKGAAKEMAKGAAKGAAQATAVKLFEQTGEAAMKAVVSSSVSTLFKNCKQ